MQPESLKRTFKRKREKSVKKSLTTADHPSNAEGKSRPSKYARVQDSPTNNSQQKRVLPNRITENEDNPSENSQNQLVIYDPSSNGAVETDVVPRQHPKIYPSVLAFTVQCARCFKWRIVPTQGKYEEIREHILEVPFFCQTGQEWRPDMSCDDPPDIAQDGSRLWAIDKPNISQPPPGWKRLVKFRCEGSTKFADVYYVAPLSKKRLRSKVEIESFLNEHPECVKQGADLSQFSFQIPKPVRDNPAPKYPALAPHTSDHEMLKFSEVQPNTTLQLTSPGYSDSLGQSLKTPSSKKKTRRLNRGASPSLSLETHVPKKRKTSTIRRCSSWFKS